MILSSIKSFFKKTQKTLVLPDSILKKRLKNVANKNSLLVYENITIYHQDRSFFIQLLILDKKHGIYLFEYKNWSYDELKHSTIQKATNQESKENALAFERTHSFLREKLKEVTHKDNVPIINYLLMENLNTYEYKHLDDSFKNLLPENNILFSDSLDYEISKKLHLEESEKEDLPDIENIMRNLLVQYHILSEDGRFHLVTNEQLRFIDTKITTHQKLIGKGASGKTNTMILKVILELLKNPDYKIIVIKPTILSCHIIKKKLLDTLENSLVKVDINSLKIIIPKEFNPVDLVLCDDAYQMDDNYIEYIKQKQKKAGLVLINPKDKIDSHYNFDKNFYQNKNIQFKKGDTHTLALLKISKLLENNSASDIIVISNNLSRKRLSDDLVDFIDEKALILNEYVHFLYQIDNKILLCEYSHISELKAKHVILMDVCSTSVDKLRSAFNVSLESVYVIYEDDCDRMSMIRENFEYD
ncbi:MAG: hypothetical protein ABGW74_05870 [Campylobacterales bacterium]